MTLSVVAMPDSSLAGLSEAVLGVAEERYGLPRSRIERRLSGGYANDLFLVRSDLGAHVLRVMHPPVDPAAIGWEHTLLNALAPRLPEVCAPLPTLDGESSVRAADRFVAVFPYIKGAPAEHGDERHRDAAAQLLGRFHAAAAELRPAQRPRAVALHELRPAIERGSYFAGIGAEARPWPTELRTRTGFIDDARAWLLDFVEEVWARRKPTQGLVHGDFFVGNVLIEQERVVGLVDWEEARLDWTLFDVSSAVWEFCKSGDKTTFDRLAAASFLASYRSAGGTLPADEDDLIVPLIRARRILEVLRSPYDRTVDWGYQLANLKAFERLG
jgi:homoserine kinase type II